MGHAFTIGVEEEFQIVDPETWELRSHVTELLASSTSLGDQIKRELHQSIVEVGTTICADVTELERGPQPVHLVWRAGGSVVCPAVAAHDRPALSRRRDK